MYLELVAAASPHPNGMTSVVVEVGAPIMPRCAVDWQINNVTMADASLSDNMVRQLLDL